MLDLLYIARFDYLARSPSTTERGHVDPRNGFVPVTDARERASRSPKRRDRFGAKPEASATSKRM